MSVYCALDGIDELCVVFLKIAYTKILEDNGVLIQVIVVKLQLRHSKAAVIFDLPAIKK